MGREAFATRRSRFDVRDRNSGPPVVAAVLAARVEETVPAAATLRFPGGLRALDRGHGPLPICVPSTRAGAIADPFSDLDGRQPDKGTSRRRSRPSLRRSTRHRVAALPTRRRRRRRKDVFPSKAEPAMLGTRRDHATRWTPRRARVREAEADGTKRRVEIAGPIYGSENPVGIDATHRIIRTLTVTSAAPTTAPAKTPRATGGPAPPTIPGRREALRRHRSQIEDPFSSAAGADPTPSRRRANRPLPVLGRGERLRPAEITPSV